MKLLKRYWALLLAIILLAGTAYLYFNVYQPEKTAFESKEQQLKTMITVLQQTIAENSRYIDVQDKLEPATAEVEASRLELYEHFPVEMKAEDQIMYVLYLETLFENEIFFEFSEAVPVQVLSDGSVLMGLTLNVNFEEFSYQGFKDMVTYLATDSRITSVDSALLEYDEKTNTVSGQIAVVLYLIDTDLQEYESPNIAIPETGKNNLYD